jgi:thiamine-phosphate pyrophosphorylase
LKTEPPPRLIAITDSRNRPPASMLARLEPLLGQARPGSVLVQLRDRHLPILERRTLGEALRALTRRHAQWLAVNDRLDLALLLDADAVHLPESGVAPEQARAFAAAHGRDWFVSAAAHAPEAAADSRADALLLAPVAEARKGRAALGAAALSRARSLAAQRPPSLGACHLYALGGVGAHNARALVDAGADGVAAIAAWLDQDVTALLAALGIAR